MTPRNPDPDETARLHESAREAVLDVHASLGLGPDVREAMASPTRGFPEMAPPERPVRTMSLVDLGDGALEWREPTERRAPPTRSFEELAPAGRSVVDIPIEILGPNEILAKLADWDERLTPDAGLKRWDGASGRLVPIPAVPPVTDRPDGSPGRILLIVHGTFSQGNAIFRQLVDIEGENRFFAWSS